MWTCGSGEYGTLGLNQPSNTQFSSPVQIPGTTWYKPIDAKKQGAGCTKTDGTLWIWGRNFKGALAQNNRTEYSSPIQFGSGTNWNNAPAKQGVSLSGQYDSMFLIEE